jgi:single-strand DNA-binding protein
MAKDLNSCSFIGRLGKDVEIKTTPSGKEVANFSIAVNSFKEDETLWLPVVTWEKLAGICSKYLSKGSQIHITGRLVIRSYDKDGEKKYITELVAENMQMLGGKGDSNQSNQGQSQNSNPGSNRGFAQDNNSNAGQSNFNNPPFNPDDDIPF